MNKTDAQLKTDIQNELIWDPKLNGERVAVTVNNGAVSLHGVVDTYAEKWAAEDAVMRVSGARTIAEHLVVEPLLTTTATLAESAQVVLAATGASRLKLTGSTNTGVRHAEAQ